MATMMMMMMMMMFFLFREAATTSESNRGGEKRRSLFANSRAPGERRAGLKSTAKEGARERAARAERGLEKRDHVGMHAT